ncbi:hypothetical protein E2C01_029615 [Portunus trituberculatus]|uniref:Uncharacterized protein n=1 Tax=Portunus trituberculatus TaxID=210409 RepID=A0A5B7ESE2_PORTR|nr:hypothetical protein [Portunus trituberculatus]
MTVDNVPKVATEVEIDEYKIHESNSNTIKSSKGLRIVSTWIFSGASSCGVLPFVVLPSEVFSREAVRGSCTHSV